jgi:GNAT superfamily N-acetyltransferase
MDLPEFTQALVAFDRQWNRYVGKAMLAAGDDLSATERAVLEALALAGEEGLAGPQIADRVAIDKGLLTRVLEGFRTRQWVRSSTDADDARLKVHRLGSRGRSAYESLGERRHAELATAVGTILPEVRAEIAARLRQVSEALEDRNPWRPVSFREARAGDYGWVIERHGAIYATEFRYDETFEAFVAEGVARFVKQHDPRRERAIVVERGGQRAGCAFVVRESAGVARLRFFFVDPAIRGLGIGGRLLDEALACARRNNYDRVVLWTQSILVSAIALYRSRGFSLVREEAYEGFGRRLRAQEWTLDLTAPVK